MDRQKELKNLYKQMSFPIGIFQIKNQVNGKTFIGSSKNLNSIFNRHRFQLKMNSHKNKNLQEEWNQYGPEAYSFDILETLKTDDIATENLPDVLADLEEKWLTTLKPYNENGYNTPPKAKETSRISYPFHLNKKTANASLS